MKPNTHHSDLKVITVLAVMLACLVGLIAMLFHDASVSESRMQPMLSAHAALLHRAMEPRAEAAAADGRPASVTPEENSSADESSAALRPEAAH